MKTAEIIVPNKKQHTKTARYVFIKEMSLRSASETLVIVPASELGFEEARPFVPPVDGLGADDGQFRESVAVGGEPGVEQAFADAPQVASLEGVAVLRGVEAALQLEQQREQPRAIGVEAFASHDEHVEDMRAGGCHQLVPGGRIVGGHVGQHLSACVELFGVEGVCVM